LKEDVLDALKSNDGNTLIHCSIPGKRKPHPLSATDTSYFEAMPMNGNLSRLVFALNRMRAPDMQVTGIAPTPEVLSKDLLPFHPSMSTVSKTYEYRISVGGFHDPTLRSLVWHVGEVELDVAKIQQGCDLLTGTQDFSAFQGAPRGPEDKRRRIEQQDKPNGCTCTLLNVEFVEQRPPMDVYFPGVTPPIRTYKVRVTGDRFLYKMMRFLVGTLVALGTGKLELDDLERAIETGNWNLPDHADRRKQFQCAPAHGLVLRHVNYGDIPINWQPLRF
jgi:tRNA pseudouridine38-40 synthase